MRFQFSHRLDPAATFEGATRLRKLGLLNFRGDESGSYVLAKYSKRAYFRQAWKVHPELTDFRGLVFNAETHEVVSVPFRKIFNYQENDAGSTLTPDSLVTVHQKINGFLGVLTVFMKKHQVLVSTTGTFDSEFAMRVRKHLELETEEQIDEFFRKLVGWESQQNCKLPDVLTFLFEIVDRDDPHIAPDEQGAWLLGVQTTEDRNVFSGLPTDVTEFGKLLGYMIPVWSSVRWEDVLNIVKLWGFDAEGFVVYPTTEGPFKIKGKWYLSLKFLSRTKKNLEPYFTGQLFQQWDEEIDQLVKLTNVPTYAQWSALSEGEKLNLLKAAAEKLCEHTWT